MYVSRGQAELVRKIRKVSRLRLSKGKRREEGVRELEAKLDGGWLIGNVLAHAFQASEVGPRFRGDIDSK